MYKCLNTILFSKIMKQQGTTDTRNIVRIKIKSAQNLDLFHNEILKFKLLFQWQYDKYII